MIGGMAALHFAVAVSPNKVTFEYMLCLYMVKLDNVLLLELRQLIILYSNEILALQLCDNFMRSPVQKNPIYVLFISKYMSVWFGWKQRT